MTTENATTTAPSHPDRVDVSARIPQDLADGLAKGLYERFGGAIRDVASKEIVAWLREAVESGAPLSADILTLAVDPASAAALNLALTGMGFAVVRKRLETIQGQLREMQQVLETIDYKIDVSFYANFRAALDLATNSFGLTNPEARRVSSLQAINRFLEAEHHYTELVDIELANQSQVADDYLVTLCLAYVTEAWCYLELDELDTAQRRLQEGQRVVRPRFERHIRTLLTSNPAAYLHPSVRPAIDLSRLTRVFRWLTPGTTENTVFEAQRQNLFNLARQPQDWIDCLPQAIRLPVKSRFFGQKKLADLSRQLNAREMTRRFGGLIGAFTPAMKAAAARMQSIGHADDNPIFATLPETFSLIEAMIEHCSRFEAYLDEVRTMRHLGIRFDQWQRIAPSGTPEGSSARLMCIKIAPRVN
jgi:hypothetical protein